MAQTIDYHVAHNGQREHLLTVTPSLKKVTYNQQIDGVTSAQHEAYDNLRTIIKYAESFPGATIMMEASSGTAMPVTRSEMNYVVLSALSTLEF